MRKNLFVLSLASLAVLGAASCAANDCADLPPVVQEVVKSFKLTLEESEGVKVENLQGLTDGKCESGSKITFNVTLQENFVLESVLVGDEALLPNVDGGYSFRMPNADTTLKVTAKNLITEDLTTITKVKDDFVGPKTPEEVATLLGESAKVDGKFFKNAKLTATYELLDPNYRSDYSGFDVYDFDIKAGRNGVLNKTGLKSSFKETEKFYNSTVVGIENGYLYEVNESADSSKINTSALTYKLTDSTENLGANEINKDEAQNKANGYLYANELANTYFKDSSSIKFLNADTSVKTSVDASKEYFTVELELIKYSSYSGADDYKLVLKFDGDNFLTSAVFTNSKFKSADYDTANKVIKDGAEPQRIYTVAFNATRGNKVDLVEGKDVKDLVYSNFDVVTTCAPSGATTTTVTNDGDVLIFANLTFNFVNKGTTKGIIKPRFAGVIAGDASAITLDGSSMKIKKPGEYTLSFDDGLGNIKQVKLNALVPETKTISGSMASQKSFVGEPNVLTVKSLPEGSDSKANVTKATGSVDCDIVENDDGTFNITPKAVGDVILDVKLKTNEKIATTVRFEALDKPNYEALYQNMINKSFYKNVSGEKFCINFNADGTGKAYVDSYGDIITMTFKYTLNKETLEFTFTDITSDGNYKFVGAKVVANDEINGTFSYFGSNNEIALKATDRKTYE